MLTHPIGCVCVYVGVFIWVRVYLLQHEFANVNACADTVIRKGCCGFFFFFFPFLCTFVIHGAPGWATDDAFNHTTALLRKTIDLVHS